MKTIFYLTKEEVSLALQNYVLDTFCYIDSDAPEVTTVVEAVNIPTLNDKYAAEIHLTMEKG